jgi:predicted transcriptional regulator of viral defense system
MKKHSTTQSERAIALLTKHGLVRLGEFTKHGITATTIQRLERKGRVARLARGLYQLPGAELDTHHTLAEAAKLVPKAIVCLTSALAYHELTDTIPSRVWLAIGPKEWRPRVSDPPLQFVRFGPKVLNSGVETHKIEGVEVRIYNPAKTIVDMFRYRHAAGRRYQQSPGLNLAIEGLRNGLRSRKVTASAIAKFAEEARVWKVIEPYLDAMTANE